MENGGLGNTITGSIGDACPPEDRCFRDIASFHKNNYAICSFLKKSRGRYKYRKKLNKSYNLIKPAISLKQQSSHSSPIRPTTVSPSPPLSTPAHECRESKQIIFKRALIWNEWSVLTLLIFTIIQIIPSTFFLQLPNFTKIPQNERRQRCCAAQQERQLWTENDVRREWERQLKVYVQREATPSTTHRPPISTWNDKYAS
jgi:hypothetical protein